jgi:cyclopropane fatty-acyl-phospholipid synthase-like methyltransferase
MEIRDIAKKPVLFVLRLLHLEEHVRKMLRTFFNVIMTPERGMLRYSMMQSQQYKGYTRTYEDAKKLCVGKFEEHEAYPYERYLLEKYDGKTERSLDFGCGIGRMMKRMLDIFEHVDGADLMEENLDYARRYLSRENTIEETRYNLFKTDGLGCKISPAYKYEFIYSTICLQHIAVHRIRYEIFCDLFKLLKEKGQCCFQMGFGWDNGVHWFNNEYGARRTNAGLDVSIPDDSHLPMIEEDFRKIGFTKVEYVKELSPHKSNFNSYHPYWLFIHLWK